jgi:hypothetical protein
MGNPQKSCDQMNKEAWDPLTGGLLKAIDAVAKHLPLSLPADRSCIPEDSIVQLSKISKSSELRAGLGEFYRAGYFGRHDVVSGYAWCLAAWNCGNVSYDEQFRLAETQQFYEFYLSKDEQAEAIRLLKRVIPRGEKCCYVVGTLFNAKWWGWEDDPIPARPGERDFKAQFVRWLVDGCYDDGEILDIVARCPQSDGPSQRDRTERLVNERLAGQSVKVMSATNKIVSDR